MARFENSDDGTYHRQAAAFGYSIGHGCKLHSCITYAMYAMMAQRNQYYAEGEHTTEQNDPSD